MDVGLGLLGLAGLAALLVVGVHIGVALGITGIVGLAVMVGPSVALSMAANSFYYTIAAYELITIPLFILMGYLASAGGMSRAVFKSVNDWVGHLRGGIGTSTIVSCTAFGAVCGSSLVTSSVFARICAPEMRRFGYDRRIAYGICASGGMIGMLIPPSILMVIYGVLAGESIGQLLIAGVVPGILLMVVFSATTVLIARFRPDLISQKEQSDDVPLSEKLRDLLKIWQVWFVALIIFGGIFGGVFNPTEAAAVASAFMIMLVLLSRFRNAAALFREAFRETAVTAAMIFLVLAGAGVFSNFLVFVGLTDAVLALITGLDLSPLVLIWLLVIMYGLLGCVLDSISMLSITIPILTPVAYAAGFDPIWYAVVVIMAIEAGLITPPVGLNVYGAYAVAEPDVRLEEIFVGVVPYLIAVWVAIAILIFFPDLSTFLPRLMFGS